MSRFDWCWVDEALVDVAAWEDYSRVQDSDILVSQFNLVLVIISFHSDLFYFYLVTVINSTIICVSI